MTKSGFYGWKLLAVFWVALFVLLGCPPYGAGVINTYMAEQLHFDRTLLALPFSVYLIMSGLPGPLVAMLVNRKGLRFTMILGGLIMIAGTVGMATMVSGQWGAIIAE